MDFLGDVNGLVQRVIVANLQHLFDRLDIDNIHAAGTVGEPAVAGLSRRLATELALQGISVNTVMPGPVMTPRFAGLHKDRMDRIASIVPMGRFGTPEEIAHAVWFLSTPGAGFATSSTLDVNGGGWNG